MTVTVKANAVTDAAGNSNPVSATTSNIHIDTIVPTVSISGVPTGEQKEAFPLTITFLEDVSGFATEDLTVPGQATATVVSGGPKVYTATITPTANQEDDVTVTVNANAVTDTAGNSNPVSATTSAIHIDTIAPTATISGLPSGEQKGAFRNDHVQRRCQWLCGGGSDGHRSSDGDGGTCGARRSIQRQSHRMPIRKAM